MSHDRLAAVATAILQEVSHLGPLQSCSPDGRADDVDVRLAIAKPAIAKVLKLDAIVKSSCSERLRRNLAIHETEVPSEQLLAMSSR